MFLDITHTTQEVYEKALAYFSVEYIEALKLKPFYKESLIGRYVISQKIGGGYLPKEQGGLPHMYDKNYWSLSHKKGLVFSGVSETQLGIDVECIKERDISLLDSFSEEQYNQLQGKNWKNFYRLWTMHESMIKFEREQLYKDGMYSLLSYEKSDNTVGGLDFDSVAHFSKDSKIYKVFTGSQGNILYSICY